MGDLGLCVCFGSCAPSWCKRILVSLNRTGESQPTPWRSALTRAPSAPRRGGWCFDVCLSFDVGTTAHRMFFRSVFWQMEAVN